VLQVSAREIREFYRPSTVALILFFLTLVFCNSHNLITLKELLLD
jgi:hypothetical protein